MKFDISFWLHFINFFVIVFAEYEEILKNAGPVEFVHILYRHGARTPEHPFPLDPYKNDSFWPIGWGQLTNPGKLQHYQLGQWFRQRYIHLIPNGKYNENLIYIQSTDKDRTLMSALSNLAGMFPPEDDEFTKTMPWQPIPVHTTPEILDKVLAVKHPCPKYDEYYDEFLKSKFMKEYNANHKQLYDYISKNVGSSIDNPKEIEYVYSNLDIESNNNYTLQNWTTSVFPDKMKPVAAFSFAMSTFTRDLKRLKAGPLLKEILEHMEEKRKGLLTPNRNFWMYSAHDTTVSNFLNTLGVFDVHIPPFIATVLLELRKNTQGEESVVVFYKNTTAEPTLLTIPGCTPVCPLDKFKSLLADVIPEDWDTECHSHQLFDLTSDQPYNSLAIFEESEVIMDDKPNSFRYQKAFPDEQW